jgi:hypothetical protein
MTTLVELIKLRLDELSGVDQPANLLDGWLVMKSAGATGIDNDAVIALFKAAAQTNVTSDSAQMRTLAPVYSPGRADYHNEHVSAAELERAALEFTKAGPRPLSLQHDDFGKVQIGTVESMFVWPYEATVPITKVGEKTRTVTLPAGTLYAWCKWTKAAWDTLVTTGKLNGLSVGGRAVRVASTGDLPPMGDTVVGKAGRVLSAKNMSDLAACIAMLQELHSRGALPETTTKARDGSFLIANEATQEVYVLTPDRIEVLGV